jgi:hypothetical protein
MCGGRELEWWGCVCIATVACSFVHSTRDSWFCSCRHLWSPLHKGLFSIFSLSHNHLPFCPQLDIQSMTDLVFWRFPNLFLFVCRLLHKLVTQHSIFFSAKNVCHFLQVVMRVITMEWYLSYQPWVLSISDCGRRNQCRCGWVRHGYESCS